MEMNSTLSEKKWRFLRVLLMSLLLGMLMLPVEAQNRVTVSGRLTDTGQNPLIGASVIEQGTTNGVTTDVDGRYVWTVSDDHTVNKTYVVPGGFSGQGILITEGLSDGDRIITEGVQKVCTGLKVRIVE